MKLRERLARAILGLDWKIGLLAQWAAERLIGEDATSGHLLNLYDQYERRLNGEHPDAGEEAPWQWSNPPAK